ncbi:Zn-dependent hydrolase oxidoreductase family [Favolaschia claudopus]|uniref:Zn-dependent hydrolase oxidoreductase family n=1 Tax=Favolaschia claudopus TaxID=2862362 RepID=A0AAW0A6G7_9AGAR
MSIQVSETPAQASAREERQKAGQPAHWLHSKPTEFHNPWPSFRSNQLPGFKDAVTMLPYMFSMLTNSSSVLPDKETVAKIPIQKPTWGVGDSKLVAENAQKIKATWLGHACFLVELPSATAGVRGPRILFDPVFSDRCSPNQWMGPKRYTPPPCSLEDIPEIDAIVISHNHYDHMDTTSLTNLLARTPAPHVFAPLGNESYFEGLSIPASRAHCLDWWDARRVTSSAASPTTFDITFTPGQHFTGRGLRDRFKSLWGGWVVESSPSPQTSSSSSAENTTPPARIYFGGDTGYRSVPSDTDDGPDTLPVCPAFKEIGARFASGFDFAMIPIGAYQPRRAMSPVHCAPRDSVALFQDIRARRALGMHWGAWFLTTEHALEPPRLLKEEGRKKGIEEGAFGVCGIGETVVFEVGGKAEGVAGKVE